MIVHLFGLNYKSNIEKGKQHVVSVECSQMLNQAQIGRNIFLYLDILISIKKNKSKRKGVRNWFTSQQQWST